MVSVRVPGVIPPFAGRFRRLSGRMRDGRAGADGSGVYFAYR